MILIPGLYAGYLSSIHEHLNFTMTIMTTVYVHLNLPKDTTYLPVDFYFHDVDPEKFPENETFQFIDQETQLTGVRSVILFRKVDLGHQNTFYAFIKDNE